MGIVSSAKKAESARGALTVIVSIPDGDSFLREAHVEAAEEIPSQTVSIPDGDSFLREDCSAKHSAYPKSSFNPRWG